MTLDNMQNSRRGFTLIEILTAIIIVVILVVIAAPMYERTIERSNMAEARSLLVGLQDAKLLAMVNMHITAFSSSECQPNLLHLNVVYDEGNSGISFATKLFTYSLAPSGTATNANGVCAIRRGGDGTGTIFYYYRPFGKKGETGEATFACNDSGSSYSNACEKLYGMDNTNGITCSTACGS